MLAVRIPIIYFDRIIAHAKIDADFSDLSFLTWNTKFTARFRNLTKKRPDLVVAYLKEDFHYRMMLYPRTCLQQGLWVQLVQCILRPELYRLVTRFQDEIATYGPQGTREKINQIRHSVGRIIYKNGDRTDCRLSNLRELKRVTEVEVPTEESNSGYSRGWEDNQPTEAELPSPDQESLH